MRDITHIVVHGTGHKPLELFDMDELAKNHYRRGIRPGLPDSRTAFHFIIDRDGTVQMGRKLSEIARLCNHMNEAAVAVALVGGVGEDGEWDGAYSLQQFTSLLMVMGDMLQSVDPHLEVVGVNEITCCPRAKVGQLRNPWFTPSSWWVGALTAFSYGRDEGVTHDTDRTSSEPPTRAWFDHAD